MQKKNGAVCHVMWRQPQAIGGDWEKKRSEETGFALTQNQELPHLYRQSEENDNRVLSQHVEKELTRLPYHKKMKCGLNKNKVILNNYLANVWFAMLTVCFLVQIHFEVAVFGLKK